MRAASMLDPPLPRRRRRDLLSIHVTTVTLMLDRASSQSYHKAYSGSGGHSSNAPRFDGDTCLNTTL